MLPIEMNLAKIERLAIQRESENFAFRMYLKGLDDKKVDRIVHRLNKQVTSQIDCEKCGNCCNSLSPRVKDEEIQILADMDQTSVEEFTLEHLEEDKFDNLFFLKATPCRYLNGKSCTIYENRPKECREYPYTHRRGFVFRTLSMITNYAICPIVFNVIENLKIALEFKESGHQET
jgi:Fe-S-cluster containining protein